MPPPNQRMKLTVRGGEMRDVIILSAAAAAAAYAPSLDLVRTLLLVSIIPTVSIATAQLPQPQPLTGKELGDFLGPVSPEAFRWSKYALVDFGLYNGEAKPPLAGHVAFYLGGHPDFKPAVNSSRTKARLGRYRFD